MNYKSIIMGFLVIFLLMSIACVNASDAADVAMASEDTNQVDLSQSNEIVTENEDDNCLTINDEMICNEAFQSSTNKMGSAGNGNYSELRNEIGSGGNISLNRSYYGYDEGDTIEITTPGVINGNGAIIDMKNKNIQVFKVSVENVTFNNLTFMNIDFNNYGGGIYFNATHGSVTNCNFTDNRAAIGSSILFNADYGSVINCSFVNNTALNTGGAIFDNGQNLCLINCSFIANTAINGGGAVYIGERKSIIRNCVFKNNSVEKDGGAIYIVHGSNVSGSNFTGNNASRSGGAIYVLVIKANIDNCIFKDNFAFKEAGAVYLGHGGSVSDSTFIDNDGDEGGAIMFVRDGKVVSCNFVNNTAKSQEYGGGAISFWQDGIVSDCNFTKNTAHNYGGAIYFDDYLMGNVTYCNFADNNASYGGAIYGGTAIFCIFETFSDTICDTNIQPVFVVSDFVSTYHSGDKLLFNLTYDNQFYDGYNVTISITQDDAPVGVYYGLSGVDGGWMVNLAPGVYTATLSLEPYKVNPANVTLKVTDGTTFWDLNKTINDNSNDTITLDKNYTYDSAFDSAFTGGIVINRSVTIIGNGYAINANGKARVFRVTCDGALLNDIAFINGNITGDGGAIYFEYGLSGTVTHCNFIDNNATSRGGAIYCASLCNVTDCNFINNNVISGSGGAIWSMGGSVGNCNFTYNSVFYYGGAVWIYYGVVTECNFIGNKAISGSGGALRFTEEGYVTNCNFTNNSAKSAGAVRFNGVGNLTNCNFNNNKATSGDGGAFYFMSNGNATNCNFTNNSASGQGGAIYFSSSGNVTYCNFINNNASDGGAIFWQGNLDRSSAEVSYCSFIENTADVGGSIYFKINATVKKSYFKDNFANNCSEIYTNCELILVDNNGIPEANSTDAVNITNVKVELSKTVFIYNAHVQKPIITLINGVVLKEGVDYTLQWANASPKNVGTYVITVTGIGAYTGTANVAFKINKAENPLKVKAKTAKVKFSKLKKKTQKLKVSKVIKFTKKGQGTLTYKKAKGNKKIAINKNTGKVTIKKGLKKGTYKVKVKVKAKGNANYKKSTFKIVTFKIKVK